MLNGVTMRAGEHDVSWEGTLTFVWCDMEPSGHSGAAFAHRLGKASVFSAWRPILLNPDIPLRAQVEAFGISVGYHWRHLHRVVLADSTADGFVTATFTAYEGQYATASEKLRGNVSCGTFFDHLVGQYVRGIRGSASASGFPRGFSSSFFLFSQAVFTSSRLNVFSWALRPGQPDSVDDQVVQRFLGAVEPPLSVFTSPLVQCVLIVFTLIVSIQSENTLDAVQDTIVAMNTGC